MKLDAAKFDSNWLKTTCSTKGVELSPERTKGNTQCQGDAAKTQAPELIGHAVGDTTVLVSFMMYYCIIPFRYEFFSGISSR